MRIVVLIKPVPDTYQVRRLHLETGLTEPGERVLDEINERALEVALAHADQHEGTEVSVMTMAATDAADAIRKALAMGAQSAVHIADENLLGADLSLTAEVLAAALQRTGFDLVIAGDISTDGVGGMLPAMLAEHLDVPELTELTELEITGTSVTGARTIEGGRQRVTAQLPAIVSITEVFPDGRFPTFKGIRSARSKPVETLTCHDLGIDPEDFTNARSIMLSVAQRPARQAGTRITDSGTAGRELAQYLIDNRLV